METKTGAMWFNWLENERKANTSDIKSAIPLSRLSDWSDDVLLIQLYDHYTRDHLIGENAFVGFAFIEGEDSVFCYGVYEGKLGGYRDITQPETLLLDTYMMEWDDKLLSILSGEMEASYINGNKNENDNERLRPLLEQVYGVNLSS